MPHELLSGPLVGAKALTKLQRDYQTASSERERRALALDFHEQAARRAAKIAATGDRSSADPSLAVADFFAQTSATRKGRRRASRSSSSPGSVCSWRSRDPRLSEDRYPVVLHDRLESRPRGTCQQQGVLLEEVADHVDGPVELAKGGKRL
jgi:hypothetical protein